MTRYNIPDRKYSDGPKEMVSMRLPERLTAEITKLCEKKGWNFTDLVTTALDQYVQYEKQRDK